MGCCEPAGVLTLVVAAVVGALVGGVVPLAASVRFLGTQTSLKCLLISQSRAPVGHPAAVSSSLFRANSAFASFFGMSLFWSCQRSHDASTASVCSRPLRVAS